jgi:hypothetical protein
MGPTGYASASFLPEHRDKAGLCSIIFLNIVLHSGKGQVLFENNEQDHGCNDIFLYLVKWHSKRKTVVHLKTNESLNNIIHTQASTSSPDM